MRFPFLGGFSTASPCPKNLLGSGKGSLQSTHPPPSCAIQIRDGFGCSVPKTPCSKVPRAGRELADRNTGRWKTIGKTPNPFPEQGKGFGSLLLPQCRAFGV